MCLGATAAAPAAASKGGVIAQAAASHRQPVNGCKVIHRSMRL